jgi:hypothetical protein
MTTPIGRLELALDGRSKLLTGLLQAVFGKSKEQIAEEEAAAQEPNPANAAVRLMDILKRRQQHDSRHKRKPPSK